MLSVYYVVEFVGKRYVVKISTVNESIEFGLILKETGQLSNMHYFVRKFV